MSSSSPKMRSKRASLELSVNVIVVMIISIVVLSLGFALFFNLKGNLEDKVKAVDDATEQKLRAMLLSGNYKVLAYPNAQITLDGGDSKLITFGVNNNYNEPRYFFYDIAPKVTYYANSESEGKIVDRTKYVVYETDDTLDRYIRIEPKAQAFKSYLLKMPKGAPDGIYIYTFSVEVRETDQQCDERNPCQNYGIVKVYVTNP